MVQLFSQYTSGIQLTAGTIVGSTLGTSGLNPIVDVINGLIPQVVDAVLLSATSTFTTIGSSVFTNVGSADLIIVKGACQFVLNAGSFRIEASGPFTTSFSQGGHIPFPSDSIRPVEIFGINIRDEGNTKSFLVDYKTLQLTTGQGLGSVFRGSCSPGYGTGNTLVLKYQGAMTGTTGSILLQCAAQHFKQG